MAVSLTVYAYLQSEQKQPNQFSIGEDNVQVTEIFTTPPQMEMSNSFEKVVAVQNTGSSEQFVRVYLDFSDSRIREKSKILYKKDGQTLEKSWNEFLDDLPPNWEYIPETESGDDEILRGYFYYTKILAPDATTTNLIDGVTTDFQENTTDTNVDKITDFNIIVYSESVQTVETDGSREYTDNEWKFAWKNFLS